MPETTPRGYPVPILSDAIDDGAGHLNAFWDLASAIDTDVAASAGVSIIDRSASTIQVVNTTTETDLYRKTIAAGALGTDGGLRLLLGGDLLNNSGSSSHPYRLKVKLGATTIFDTGTAASAILPTANAARGFWSMDVLVLNSAAAAQSARLRLGMVSGGLGGSSVAIGQTSAPIIGAGLATENTALAKDLAVTITFDAALATLDIRRLFATLEKVNP